jgi:predicted enzyme related to lactoylglutathione lyase
MPLLGPRLRIERRRTAKTHRSALARLDEATACRRPSGGCPKVGLSVSRAEIRYLQVPAADVGASASFYERALGWTARTRGDGSTAFDDTTAELSGEWLLDRQPAGDTGVLVYIRVDDVDASVETITEAGGEIVLPRTDEGEGLRTRRSETRPEKVLGVFQEGG